MNNSTNNKVVHLHPQGDDFKVLYQMVNSPNQQARRMARRKAQRRANLTKKAIHLAGTFLAGMAFMYLLIHLV